MKKLLSALGLFFAVAGVAWGANNFAINNATGTFTIIKTTDDGTGAQSLSIVGTTSPTSTVASATARGGALTAGGTAQTLMAANAARKAFSIQNPCTAAEQGIATAENLYINLTSAATVSTSANLAVLPPCTAYEMGITAGVVSGELISVVAATISHIWYAKEY